MKHLLKILLFLCGYNAFSQSVEWATTGGNPINNNNYAGAIDIAQDSAGNVYLLDRSNNYTQYCQGDSLGPFNTDGINAYIFKFDKHGNLLFINRIGSKAAGGSFYPLAIECDEAGNIYVLGYPNGTTAQSAGSQDFTELPNLNNITKFDSDGNYAWTIQTQMSGGIESCLLKYHNNRIYYQHNTTTLSSIDETGGNKLDLTCTNFSSATSATGPTFKSATTLSNGDLVFAALSRGSLTYGSTTLNIQGQGFIVGALMLVRTNSLLNLQWATYAAHGRDPDKKFIPITSDHLDNIYISAQVIEPIIVGNDTIINTNGSSSGNGTIVKVDNNGNGVWAKYLETSSFTFPWALANSTDSTGIYIGGGFVGNSVFGNDTLRNTIGNSLPFIAKMDLSGNFTMAYKVITDYSYTDITSLLIEDNNRFIIGGKSLGTGAMNFQCITTPINKGFYLAKYQDIDSVAPTPTIQANDNVLTATPSFNGGIQWYLNNNPIPGATGATFTASTTGNYTVQYKIETGCPDSAMSATYNFTPTKIEDANSISQYQIYPNPTKEILHITNHKSENLSISIRNIQGQLLQSYHTNKNDIDINCSALNQGLYILEITNQKQYFQYKFQKL